MDALKRADWTPLMLACTKAGNECIVSALLEGGANAKLKNKDGWTAFHLAARAAEEDTGVLEVLFRFHLGLWCTRKVPLITEIVSGVLVYLVSL